MNPLATIAARAGENNLGVLLSGGHAVIMHGYARTTFDVDLIVSREDKEKWTRVLVGEGYSLFHEGAAFLQFSPPGPRILPLDLMLVNEGTFAKPAPASAVGAKVVLEKRLRV